MYFGVPNGILSDKAFPERTNSVGVIIEVLNPITNSPNAEDLKKLALASKALFNELLRNGVASHIPSTGNGDRTNSAILLVIGPRLSADRERSIRDRWKTNSISN